MRGSSEEEMSPEVTVEHKGAEVGIILPTAEDTCRPEFLN